MKTFVTSVSLALLLGLGAGVVSGNAFNINEWDAQVAGRGGASTASNIGPSSIVFNPGGIAVGTGIHASIGGSLYIAEGTYESDQTNGEDVSTDVPPALTPAGFVTSRLSKTVAIGIGFHVPFGLSVKWPEGHPQQEVVEKAILHTYFITPAVGINLDRYVAGLSIGGGIDVVPATVELAQAIVFGSTVGRAHLGADAVGFGGRVGVMYRPPALSQLKFGAMWRSKVDLDFQGRGDFDIAEPFRDQMPPDGSVETTIKLPQWVSGGVAYSPMDNLELEADLTWIDWSTFKSLTIDLPGGAQSVSPQDYDDTVTFRFGAEYQLTKYDAAVRAGFVYDPTPIPAATESALLPDVNRKIITVGGSQEFGDYAIHASLLWVTPGERNTADDVPMSPTAATYGVQALVASLTVSGQFGQ